MRQRLALARTLVHDPPVLFLDEPTAALDPIASLGVRDLVRSLAAGEQRTVLICTHNLVEAQELCDRVIILRRGRIVADGSPSEVVHAAALPVGVEIDVDPEHSAAALSIASEISADRATMGTDGAIAIEGMARDAVPQLVRRLVAAGVEVYRVSPRQASLEDAYVALYGDVDSR
jgi:ABC-type multidrug transport system ATPase subunit